MLHLQGVICPEPQGYLRNLYARIFMVISQHTSRPVPALTGANNATKDEKGVPHDIFA